MCGAAHAVPLSVGGVGFDTEGGADDVVWAQGGVFSGLPQNYRSACQDDPITASSSVGVTIDTIQGPVNPTCRADEAAGFDPTTDSIELDENNTMTQDPDVLAAFWDDPVINGDGVDLILFETLNSDDPPAVTLILNGEQLMGTFLGTVTYMGETLRATGFDFSLLGLAMDAIVGEPIYIQTLRDDENTPVGSSDIVAIVATNFGMDPDPMPEVPLPAAMPLFLAGIAGLGFARGRRRKT